MTRRALSSALLGALVALTLSACSAVETPAPVSAPAPLPVAVAPALPVAAPPVAPRPTTTSPRSTTKPRPTTRKTPKPVTTNQFGDEVDTSKCTNRINYANDPRGNAEINSIGAQTGKCPKPITASSSRATKSPGELALDACQEQTGMTRSECIADSAAGNAN